MKESVPYVFQKHKQVKIILDLYERLEQLENKPIMPEVVAKKAGRKKKHICGLSGKYSGVCEHCEEYK